MWDADSEALKLSVNEWPDDVHPQSSDGTVQAALDPIHTNWVRNEAIIALQPFILQVWCPSLLEEGRSSSVFSSSTNT